MGVCPNPKKLRSTPLTPIHDYLIAFAQRLHTGESSTLLDYGCGAGEIVQLASSAGMDAYGVEMFYGGGSARDAVARAGLLGTRVLELEDGVIPFPDSRFDVIVSNQVFEHIDDFEPPVREIHRVMKSGGVFINIFPSVEVWREGHIGIPFVHWFEPGLRRRRMYTLSLRCLGLGFHKHKAPPREWTDNYLGWIDSWTFYKPLAKVHAHFEHYFEIEEYAADYLRFRLSHHRGLNWMSPFFSK